MEQTSDAGKVEDSPPISCKTLDLLGARNSYKAGKKKGKETHTHTRAHSTYRQKVDTLLLGKQPVEQTQKHRSLVQKQSLSVGPTWSHRDGVKSCPEKKKGGKFERKANKQRT